MERKIGEVGIALRTKISEVELFGRDTYIRRDTFQEMVRLMTNNIQSQFQRLEDSITKLGEKLDGFIARGD